MIAKVQSEQMKSAERRVRAQRRASVLPGGCVRTAGQRNSRWVRG